MKTGALGPGNPRRNSEDCFLLHSDGSTATDLAQLIERQLDDLLNCSLLENDLFHLSLRQEKVD